MTNVRRAVCVLVAVGAIGACQRGATPVPIGDPPLPGITNVDRALAAKLERAGAARGGSIGASKGAAPKFTNRLALQSSPYLLEHAHNPVNWYAWGPEAFARARQDHKPIFLSIGYATCHWCHVMALTVFDDEEVATYLNQQFVAIKVDREERPDVDDVYMRAVQAMTGRGGWPMTVIATPDGKPFFGGSYIPRAQILPLLHELRDAWDTRPDDVLAQAGDVSTRIASAADAPTAAALPDASAIDGAVRAIGKGFDSAHGGFGGAPKFPEPPVLDLLLRAYRRSGDASALAMATQTLDAIAGGAVHDPIGGGFHRYATDAAWRVPHFEKMLYDNAQLAMLFVSAWQATAAPRDRELAIETLDFIDRELGDAGGGFHAALDADSPGASGAPEEGAYYVWTYDQIVAVAGAPAAASLGVAPGDDRAILYTAGPVDPAARAALFAARAKRPRPPSDDELVAAWNGLAISAFARAGLAFDRPDYIARAARGADFVLASMRDDHGRLARAWVGGRASGRGGLDDHAFVIAGLIDLFEATAEPRYLAAARTLAGALDDDFGAPDGSWFATAHDAEALLARDRPAYDGPEPSGNAIAALDLIRLATLADDDAMRARAERATAAFAGAMTSAPSATAGLWSALDADRTEPLEITIVGAAPHDAAPLVDVVRRTYLPTRALALPLAPAQVDALATAVPFVGGKVARDGHATAYVCHRTRCDNPTTNPAVLEAQLAPR